MGSLPICWQKGSDPHPFRPSLRMSGMRLLPLLLTFLLPTLGVTADYTFTGYARDMKSGALLYVETHAVSGSGTPAEQRVVLYSRDDKAAPFARKNLIYGADRARPEFDFTCSRSGFRESLIRESGELRVTSTRAGAEPRTKLLPATEVRVVDAGFDEFVRANWSVLERGEAMTAPFLVPSRLTTYDFRIRKVQEVRVDGADASVIRLSLAGAIGWLLPDIEVTYRKQDQRLLRYRGLTNIRDAAGALLEAQIDFPDAGRSEGAVDLAKLRALALSGS